MAFDYMSYIPKISISGNTVVNFITFIVLTIVLIVIMGVSIYILIDRLKFNKKAVIFEEIGNDYEDSRKDRIAEIPLGKGGDTIFYLKKHKKYLPRGTIQTGRKTYWYAIRQDGEWINFGIDHIDFIMKKARIRYLDKEMRHSRTALQEIFKERYQKPSFWSVYGGVIAFAILIVVFGVMTWLLFDKFLDFAGIINGAMEKSIEVLEKLDEVITKLDKLYSTSGLREAG